MISIIDQEWQRQLEIKREREEERAENARITDYLLDQGRYDDLRRVNRDMDFRQQILDEIGEQ